MQARRDPKERYDGEPNTDAPPRGVDVLLAHGLRARVLHCHTSRVRQA